MSDLFNEKAKEWDQNEMVLQLSNGTSSAILENIDFNDKMQVMDFGAGTGLITAKVAPYVSSITAIDISQSMLDELEDKTNLKDKVKTLCQDITKQPLEQKFDVIMSAMAMHHVEDTNLLIQRFSEHMNSGAKVALADLDSEDGDFHPAEIEGVFHDGFDRDTLQNILEKNNFEDIKFVMAHTVNKEIKSYPVFLVTATKK